MSCAAGCNLPTHSVPDCKTLGRVFNSSPTTGNLPMCNVPDCKALGCNLPMHSVPDRETLGHMSNGGPTTGNLPTCSVPDHKALGRMVSGPIEDVLTTIHNQQASLLPQHNDCGGMCFITQDEGGKSDVEPSHVQPPPPSMHSANPPQAAPIGMDSADPSQMQFYKLAAHDIIERAKQFSHCDAASINAFPLRADFAGKVIEYINEAIAECQSQGLFIMDGWWPQHNAGITKLLWEDHRNWQSALKKKACNYVTQWYQWDSQNHPKINAEIAKDLLANSGRFLKNGTDDQLSFAGHK
ncbi:hypothetical protein HYDPIDRAFT_34986 [Hydnomerulius pinastri MD-312]|uniref:DUF6532 domain-containing protein n=1 Tax=Hydnomerulius pinastri MD-312 TaxID=994086 RepID=A0A0C2KJI7_9AGAM|nr:hypothetical protein HYDPIDRAFT_34986 [Hydnomerulius pinastri MD-312]